jgi:hypothetical protein
MGTSRINNLQKSFAGIMTRSEMLELTDIEENTEVYLSDDKIIYKYNGSEWVALEGKTKKTINDESDFGSPVGGKYVLETGYLYTAGTTDPVYLTYPFEIPKDSSISFEYSTFVYIGDPTEEAFQSSDFGDGVLTFDNISIASPYVKDGLGPGIDRNPGKIFNMSSTGAGSFVGNTILFGNCDGFGNMNNLLLGMRSIGFFSWSSGMFFSNNIGITISGCIFFPSYNVSPSDVSTINILGAHGIVNIDVMQADLKNGENIIDIDSGSSGIIDMNKVNMIDKFTGSFYASGSKTYTDPEINIYNCVGSPSSAISGQIEFEAATQQTTTIDATNSWSILNMGTGSPNPELKHNDEERLEVLEDGTSRYKGLKDEKLDFNGNTVVQPATAGKFLEARFFWICNGEFTVTFDNTTNQMLRTGIGSELTTDYPIILYRSPGDPPSELSKVKFYWPISINPNNIQLSYVKNGSPITFTDDGSGTLYYSNTDLPGGKGGATISTYSPLSPSALLPVKTNYSIGLAVRNTTDSVNIQCNYAFYKIKEKG